MNDSIEKKRENIVASMTSHLARNGKILEHKFRQYLFPTIFSGLSIMLGVVVDGMIVGNTIGTDAMAAISVAQPLVLVFQAVFFLFGLGSATLVAVSKGSHRQDTANAAFTTGILALIFSSVYLHQMPWFSCFAATIPLSPSQNPTSMCFCLVPL